MERKSALDLHKTIAAGRFWAQMGRLRDAGRSPHLVVEGNRLWQGPIDADAVRGLLLATSDLGIAVLRTDDVYDTARWIYRLIVRRQEGSARDRPRYAQRPQRSRQDPPAEAALAAAPGISTITARDLLSRFGSLQKVVLADPSEWQEVAGIGPSRAAGLASMIQDEWKPAAPGEPR